MRGSMVEGKCSSSRDGFVERSADAGAQLGSELRACRSLPNSRFQFKRQARVRKIGRPSLWS